MLMRGTRESEMGRELGTHFSFLQLVRLEGKNEFKFARPPHAKLNALGIIHPKRQNP